LLTHCFATAIYADGRAIFLIPAIMQVSFDL
jgi:hypothetical protein